MAATVLAQPMLSLDQSEADALAKAIGGVARHYPMKASAQTVDWVNLIMCVGTVYGTRFVAMRASAAQEQSAVVQAPNVHLFGAD